MWAHIWAFFDWCFFGPASARRSTLGLTLRVFRYPYAVLRDLARGDITLRATGLVYTTLLSVIPLVAFAFAVLKIFGDKHDLEPVVYQFFRPMGGPIADELSKRVVEFAHRVSTRVAGVVGLTVLGYTLFGTIKKVEDSFNFVWHVDTPRKLWRRIMEYLILLILGPLLLVGFLGLSHAAWDNSAVQEVAAHAGVFRHIAIHLAPYVMVTVFFTAMYMLIPNTRVYWRPALIGALVAGVLWAAVGKIFTEFVVYSVRLQIIYAGFAFIVAALLWTYFGWLILLAGAQLSFYIQNPTYLRFGLWEIKLSSLETEQLALRLMYLLARSQLTDQKRWNEGKMAHELGLPGVPMSRLIAAFQEANLLRVTEQDELQLTREVDRITVCEILDAARDQRSGQIHVRDVSIPSVDRVIAALETARKAQCGGLTLLNLVEESQQSAPAPAARQD